MPLSAAAAIAAQAEALTLNIDLLANDLEYLAEVNALTPEIEKGVVLMLTKARQMVDAFARSLPKVKPPKNVYTGPRTHTHYHKIADAEAKLLTNGRKK